MDYSMLVAVHNVDQAVKDRLLGSKERVCFSQYTIVLEGCMSQYIRLLYWKDASHNTLDYCIGGIHLTIH